MRWLLGVFLLLLTAEGARAQKPPASAPPVRSVRLAGGMSWPVSHEGLTRYWRAGPAGSLEFDVRIRRRYLVGVGVDVAALWFRASRFGLAHPGVPLENKPVAQITIALSGRVELLPEKRIGPYCGLSIGASRLTAAVYQQVIDSVRVTYFRIPGRTRLSAAGFAGVTFYATRWLGFEAESRLLYVHNDPDAGVTVALRTGIRFSF